MPSFEVIIGLILILLLYSLLATILLELIAGFTALRGKQLEKVLKNLLSTDDPENLMLNKFRENLRYQQLAGKFLGKKSPPSYLQASSFRAILMQIIDGRRSIDSLRMKISDLPDANLSANLEQLRLEADNNIHRFQEHVERWYDETMDQATGWYKRKVQGVLLILGIGIAIFFNVDSLTIYGKLVSNVNLDIEQMALLAETINENGDVYENSQDSAQLLLSATQPAAVSLIGEEILELLEKNIQQRQDPLGIGWSGLSIDQFGVLDWMKKILGWLITTLAISLGAPFWFDLLKRIMNIRSTGHLQKVIPPQKVLNEQEPSYREHPVG